MSTPRTRPEPPVKSASSRNHQAAILEPKLPGVARSDAELRRVIESAASRLLVLAIAHGGEERDPDEE